MAMRKDQLLIIEFAKSTKFTGQITLREPMNKSAKIPDRNSAFDYPIKLHFEKGELHREDGPAVDNKGVKAWLLNGEYARKDNLPHVEYDCGTQQWFDGKNLVRTKHPNGDVSEIGNDGNIVFYSRSNNGYQP